MGPAEAFESLTAIAASQRTGDVGSCRLRGAREHHGPEEGGRHAFESVGPCEDGHILAQKPLAHSTERMQKGAQPGPDAFKRSVVDFADAVAICVACPLAVAGGVADVGWARPVAGKRSYACHTSVLTVASGRVWASTKGCKVARSLWAQPVSGSGHARARPPAIGTRSVSQAPCPRVSFARRRGGSNGSAWLRPCSPAFWYKFIGLDDLIRQRAGGGKGARPPSPGSGAAGPPSAHDQCPTPQPSASSGCLERSHAAPWSSSDSGAWPKSVP